MRDCGLDSTAVGVVNTRHGDSLGWDDNIVELLVVVEGSEARLAADIVDLMLDVALGLVEPALSKSINTSGIKKSECAYNVQKVTKEPQSIRDSIEEDYGRKSESQSSSFLENRTLWSLITEPCCT